MIHSINKKIMYALDSLGRFSNEASGKLTVLAITTLALTILSPPMILPLCITFCGFLGAKGFIKIKESFHNNAMQKIGNYVENLASRFPKLERYLLIFSVAISWLNPFFGAFFGGITGIYIGMIERKPEENPLKLITGADLQPAISASSL